MDTEVVSIELTLPDLRETIACVIASRNHWRNLALNTPIDPEGCAAIAQNREALRGRLVNQLAKAELVS